MRALVAVDEPVWGFETILVRFVFVCFCARALMVLVFLRSGTFVDADENTRQARTALT